MSEKINKFFDTAIGKSVQTFLWTFAAYGITILTAYLAGVQWSDQFVALGIPGIINWILYSAKVFIDKEVPNLPSSQPMMLVPKPNNIVTQPITVPIQVDKTNVDELLKNMSEQINNPVVATELELAKPTLEQAVDQIAEQTPPIS